MHQFIRFIFDVTLLKLPKDPLLLIFGPWDPQLLPWSLNTNTHPPMQGLVSDLSPNRKEIHIEKLDFHPLP